MRIKNYIYFFWFFIFFGLIKEVSASDIGISFTLNYFKIISDSSPFLLKSKKSTDPYSGEIIYPKSNYRPGFELSLKFPKKIVDWQSEIMWTSIQNIPKETEVHSENYTIFSLPPSPSIASPQGHFSNECKSKSSTKLNVFDWEFNNRIKVRKSLTIIPIIGFEGFFLEQNMKAKYKDILPAGPFELTSCVHYKNNNWGVGPLIGASISLVFPHKIMFNVSSKLSSLLGASKSVTKFANLNAPSSKYKSNEDKLFYHSKMQASLSKETIGSRFVLKLVVGWETNIFSKQLNEKYYGNATTGQPGSDLTLQGPFFKLCLTY